MEFWAGRFKDGKLGGLSRGRREVEEGAAVAGIGAGAAGVAGGPLDIDVVGGQFGDRRQLVRRGQLGEWHGPGRGG